jgi:hypothetical protein
MLQKYQESLTFLESKVIQKLTVQHALHLGFTLFSIQLQNFNANSTILKIQN